jgi:predicted O-methyltransferase YrrM
LEIIDKQAGRYADFFTSEEDGLLAEIADFTCRTHSESHMLSGHVQGQLLGLLSRMIRPARILEIGTFTGYSALCLAKGLMPGGMLHTLEKNAQDAEIAAGYFDRSRYRDQIKIHVGDALKYIETLKETWDLVFIDADKINYVNYYDAVFPSLKKGGWMIADNVLFHGEVLKEPIRGKNARAIDAFNRHVKADDRSEQVMLTVRDGLMLIYKK